MGSTHKKYGIPSLTNLVKGVPVVSVYLDISKTSWLLKSIFHEKSQSAYYAKTPTIDGLAKEL